MPDILHRVGIKAKPKDVYKAVSTINGLSHWWVVGTKGSNKKGGIIDFGFTELKVVESKPGKLVKWKCVRGPKEWIDTEISFELKKGNGQTFVIFKHACWKRPVEFMHHCSTKWAVFLFSLKDWLEKEEGRPYPYDMKIHVGD
ncbi:MAG: SRPBCC domain-containing protein [Nitrospirae bacterium]|nr:SRPBCC domain-containing protein [Nitrospirota bacterium]MBI3594161.1 SRPBCC domain-containing protein [Nitrospirota bacterium]